LKIPKKHRGSHKTPSRATCGPWVACLRTLTKTTKRPGVREAWFQRWEEPFDPRSIEFIFALSPKHTAWFVKSKHTQKKSPLLILKKT